MIRAFFLSLLAMCLTLSAAAQIGETPATDTTDEGNAPIKVTVGMYINDIQAIDLRTHSYGMDFYLWFRWFGDDIDPSQGFEFMNTFDPEAHVETRLYDEPQPQPDGSRYQIIRHQGLFTTKFPVAAFPFDHQELVISVEDAEEGSDALVYVADADGLTLNEEIKLPGYRVESPFMTVRDKHYPTAFGDLSEPDVAYYSRADFFVPIGRPAVSGIFKAFVPIFLIISAAAFALLLDPAHVEARIGLAITALLTLVAMQFTMMSGLPEVAYLTLLDQLFMMSYLYIVAVIAIIVRSTRIDEQGAMQGELGMTDKIMKRGPLLAGGVTGIYLLIVIVIIVINLAGR